jgi:hypothetical protein
MRMDARMGESRWCRMHVRGLLMIRRDLSRVGVANAGLRRMHTGETYRTRIGVIIDVSVVGASQPCGRRREVVNGEWVIATMAIVGCGERLVPIETGRRRCRSLMSCE